MIEKVEEFSFKLRRDWGVSHQMEGRLFGDIEPLTIETGLPDGVKPLIPEGAECRLREVRRGKIAVHIAMLIGDSPGNVGSLSGIAHTGAVCGDGGSDGNAALEGGDATDSFSHSASPLLNKRLRNTSFSRHALVAVSASRIRTPSSLRVTRTWSKGRRYRLVHRR